MRLLTFCLIGSSLDQLRLVFGSSADPLSHIPEKAAVSVPPSGRGAPPRARKRPSPVSASLTETDPAAIIISGKKLIRRPAPA